MKIFYFSGTGNSYSVARQLGRELHGDMLSIPDYLASPFDVADEVIGFVTPTYSTDLPPVTAAFLQAVRLTKPKYIFGVATMGAMTGRTLAHAYAILQKRGLNMQGAFTVTLPDNSIVFPSGEAKAKRFLSEEESKVHNIADSVRSRCNNAADLDDSMLWQIVASVGMWGLNTVFDVKNRKVDVFKCVGCGICAAICPGNFIVMDNGKPRFKAECFTCFGCAHWCPQGAISLGRLHPSGAVKYVHPGIPFREFAGQIKLELND